MPTYFSGLDLGQSQDFSALVVLEQSAIPDPDTKGRYAAQFDVCHIHRWELKTPYPTVVENLHRWFEISPLRNSTLVVDGTGVGQGIVDMITATPFPAVVRPFKITCGNKPGDGTVPKVDLVGAVQSALQTGRLRFAEELPLTEVLVKELENFRVKVTADRNETYSAWREADHDDLVLALAPALWYGEKHATYPPGPPIPRPPPILPAWMGKLRTTEELFGKSRAW